MKTIFLLAFALLTVLTPFAHATPPTTATGTFTASFTVLSVTTAGGNTIITVNETATLTGSFGGTRAGGFVVNDGTGALEDIHGYGPFQFTATGPTSTTGTYSVTIHA